MPFNVYDSYTLTETVNRSVQTALEGEAYIGDQFMPLVPVRDRKIKRAMTQVAAVGMANFKAPHATPTIFIPQIQFDEEYNVAVSPSWASRATSTPTANIRAAQKYLFQTLGVWGSRIFMGPDTYENWQYSTEVKNLLKPNSGGSDFIIPTVDQLESLLYGGVNGPDRPRPGMPRPTVYVTSAGFRAQNTFTV
jgi:hypothetical protein